MDLLIELHYLPCIQYFTELLRYDVVWLEAQENYQKQSYRNRCYLLGANNVNILTVPVTKLEKKILTRDLKIDNRQSWQGVHWKTIASAYGKAPFFEYYSDLFREILYKKHSFLWDLNLDLMTLCLKLLGIKKTIKFTEMYNFDVERGVIDFRDRILPDINNQNIDNTTYVNYKQVFGSKFVPNLSIIDLLFLEGESGLEIIERG